MTKAWTRIGVVAALTATTLVVVGPAAAVEPLPPVVVDDRVALYPGQGSSVDVLANDSAPSGDDLQLCRFPDDPLPDAPRVLVLPGSLSGDDTRIDVVTNPRAHGTHVVDFFVCDKTHLAPAKLTITVLPVAPVKVRKVPGKPGRLRVTNTNTKQIRFWYGHPQASRPDAKVVIRAGATRTVRVQRHRIYWVALIGGGSVETFFDGPGVADQGRVRNIAIRGPELPVPKEPGGESSAERAWRR